jgi:sucrose-6-phosphate hydrolase SacC (GH32 family)
MRPIVLNMNHWNTCANLVIAIGIQTATFAAEGQLDLEGLRNPVWQTTDNLRDPSVFKTREGYWLFYSRFSGRSWSSPANWAIACVFTRDFRHFDHNHDVSPKGYASPGDVVLWHGRYLLPYQSYPAAPNRLCYSQSTDLRSWSAPEYFLDEARSLPWNQARRLIDPTFVIDGGTLHCFFVGSGFRQDGGGKKVRGNLVGHAITHDPKLKRWNILSVEAPVIGFSERAPDGVENVMVIRTGNYWTMIYSEGLADQHLALATSPDLIKWTLEGPITIIRQSWNKRKYGAPFIWREGSQWVMILMGTNEHDRTSFGLLKSTDGKRWQQLLEKTP